MDESIPRAGLYSHVNIQMIPYLKINSITTKYSTFFYKIYTKYNIGTIENHSRLDKVE